MIWRVCYSLRLQKLGLIKSNPQRIAADGTHWRYLGALKGRARDASSIGHSARADRPTVVAGTGY